VQPRELERGVAHAAEALDAHGLDEHAIIVPHARDCVNSTMS